jgi:hypothetical protein
LDEIQEEFSPLLLSVIEHLGKLLSTVDMVSEIYQRIPKLLALSIKSLHKATLQRFVLVCLSATVPYGLLPPAPQLQPTSPEGWAKSIEDQWTTSCMKATDDVLQALENLSLDSLDDLNLVSPLVYRSSKFRSRFAAFIQSLKPTRPGFLSALRTLLECSLKQDDYLATINARFASVVTKAALTASNATERELSQICMGRMLEVCEREQVYAALRKYSNDIHDTRALPFLGGLAKRNLISPQVADMLFIGSLKHIISLLSDKYLDEDVDRVIMSAVGECQFQF